MSDSPSPSRWRHLWLIPRIALGLLILWQFCFLLAVNLIGYVSKCQRKEYRMWEETIEPSLKDTWLDEDLTYRKDNGDTESASRIALWLTTWDRLKHLEQSEEPADRMAYHTRRTIDGWARLTGQEQQWSLFAPWVSRSSTFPTVELRWDLDGLDEEKVPPRLIYEKNIPEPVRLPSLNWRGDLDSYFRIGGYRVRRYDFNVSLTLRSYDRPREEVIAAPDWGWNATIFDWVWENDDKIRAFLRWRARLHLEEHPDLPPPTQVRLLCQTWVIGRPDGDRAFKHTGEEMVPVARWLPWKKLSEEDYLVQYYDVVEERFRTYVPRAKK